ncbi:hypothetical protein CC86DRAFT_366185 [Ophiobolus disseminans]|uniref:FHA domain-containing protein n=1 Tax=Ophiobolus disseminans TaxID=1469910 RepID=A0A6A7AHG9_9PLEO|nr:hypothetical protein CC86DRAFT_366185 [Ophiobolus disseminans]
MPQTFRVVLRDAEGFEGLDSRRFDLAVGAAFPIGRASRNTTKKDLMPAEHNAFIDSPVISRDHAVLSASTVDDVPKVFITDSNSMHGTTVNGQRLVANTPQQLSSGDTIQFGIDVNRNEEFYVARKYTFEAEVMPPQAPFSLGFTVPEPESEDEDIPGTTPHRGSQTNPLTIDESDSESDTSNNEPAEITMIGEVFIVQANEPAAVSDFVPPHEPGGENSEDEESLGRYPSDIDIHLDEDMDSQASIMGDSVVDYSSDMEVSDVEAEDGSETTGQHAATETELPLQEQPTAPNLPPWANRDLSLSFNQMQGFVNSSLPPMMMMNTNNQNMTSFAPPLPPRPSAARPSIFDRGDVVYSQKPSWLSDDVNTFSNFLGTNHGDRPSLFSPAPASSMAPPQEAESAATTFSSSSVNFAPINSNRLQTPPAMPLSDVTTSTPPAPNRRTKVSITEIVEEQPPTPESVNEMKRKVDVLEEEETSTPEEEVIVPVDETVPAVEAFGVDASGAEAPATEAPADTVAVQTAAIIAQRPKKQPRSILSRLQNTATYLGYGVAGAAGGIALLATLPDGFFFA